MTPIRNDPSFFIPIIDSICAGQSRRTIKLIVLYTYIQEPILPPIAVVTTEKPTSTLMEFMSES